MNPLEKLFPIINDWALSSMAEERAKLLSQARGTVVELGAGTGLNLAHYPDVESLTAIEPSDVMRARAEERRASTTFPVRLTKGFAEKLPVADASADTVVSTFVLCSVRDLSAVFAEIRRILKPGGRLLLLEHVRSEDPKMARWQDLVTPVWKRVLGGCHPNRDIAAIPETVGLRRISLRRFKGDQPALAAPHIAGIWAKP